MNPETLLKKIEMKGYLPLHAAEVGVYQPHNSRILPLIEKGIRCTLVEPLPAAVEAIRKRFAEYSNVTLYPFAVFDKKGQLQLVHRAASTYVSSLDSSPAKVNGKKSEKEELVTVQCITFDEIDDGSINYLSIDTEGSEWFVLKNLRSRPEVIAIETHGGGYINPYMQEITSWMKCKGYSVYLKDKSDSIYVRNDFATVSLFEKISLFFTDTYLFLRRIRKRATRKLLK